MVVFIVNQSEIENCNQNSQLGAYLKKKTKAANGKKLKWVIVRNYVFNWFEHAVIFIC